MLALIVSLNTLIAQVKQYLSVYKPCLVSWKFSFEHRVVMGASRKSLTDKENHLACRGQNRILQCVLLFSPL